MTLIELLVVLGIVAVLASMLLLPLRTVKEAARALGCQSNLRQVGLALCQYQADNDSLLPPSYFQYSSWIPGASDFAWSDPERLGGYLEEARVVGGRFTSKPYTGVLRCPSDPLKNQSRISYGLSRYFFPYADIAAGEAAAWLQSKTILRVRRPSEMVFATDTHDPRWCVGYDPVSGPPTVVLSREGQQLHFNGFTAGAYHSAFARHRDGLGVLFADGHVAATTTLPADVLAGRVFVRTLDLP